MNRFLGRIPGILLYLSVCGLSWPFFVFGDQPIYEPSTSLFSKIQPGKPLPVAPYAAGVVSSRGADSLRAAALEGAALLDPTFGKCGQECLYQKSKEALSIQMEYLLSKRKFIQMPDLTVAQVRAIAGGFCYDMEPKDSCQKRYLKWTDFWLLKARGSLAASNQAIAALTTDFQTGVKTIAFAPIEGSQKATQMPYVITVDQLRALASGPGLESLNQIQSNEDWIQSCLGTGQSPGLKPEPMDFARFKKILRDPNNPRSSFLEVPDGFDTKAYQAALKDWEKFTSPQNRDGKEGLYATLRGRDEKQGGIKKVIADRQNELKLQRLDDPSGTHDMKSSTSHDESLDLQLFKASRMEYIQQVNSLKQEQIYTKKNNTHTSDPILTGREQVNATMQDAQTQRSFSASFEPSFIQPRTGKDPSLDMQQGLDAVRSDTSEVIFFPDPES